MNVFVFKTSVGLRDLSIVSSILSNLLSRELWNVDLEDIDRVLRLECTKEIALEACCALRSVGFDCEELR